MDQKIGANLLRKESNFKQCFHEDGSCGDRIIKAHAISNNRVLRSIAKEDKGDVLFMSLEQRDNGTTYVLGNTGRGKATVFSGFCNMHDMRIFQPIDDSDYLVGDKHQEFLFAYRTLAKEYHSKQTAIRMNGRLIKLIEADDTEAIRRYLPGYIKREGVLGFMRAVQVGMLDSLKELEKMKTAMNTNLDRGRYWKLDTWVVELSREYPIAVSAVIKSGINFHAQSATDKSPSPPACSLFTVFPQGGKTYALFSVPKTSRWFYGFYDELTAMPEEGKKRILSHIIIRWTENIVAGKTYWEGFSEEWRANFQSEWEGTASPIPSFVQAVVSPRGINLFKD